MSNNGNFIKKHHKDRDFTILDNNIFKNKNLSLKAKGLLSMLLSLPNNWQFSERGLTALSKDGRDSLRSGLDELEDNGYLKRERVRNESGQFIKTVYNVYETPLVEEPRLVKPTVVNPTVYKELNDKELNNRKDIVVSKETTKDNIPYQEIISYLNEATGRNFRNVESNKRLIKARFNEGYTLEDFKTVIDVKISDWQGTEYERYLQPSTLFSNKFDGYLNQSFVPRNKTREPITKRNEGSTFEHILPKD